MIDLQPPNILHIVIALEVSHNEISGKDIIDSHLENRPNISFIFFVYQLDISGINFKEKQPENELLTETRLLVFHLEISGIYLNFLQS